MRRNAVFNSPIRKFDEEEVTEKSDEVDRLEWLVVKERSHVQVPDRCRTTQTAKHPSSCTVAVQPSRKRL